jgi:7-carboxy-7-deazaguanine synthase
MGLDVNYAQLNAKLLKERSRPGCLLINEVYGRTIQGEGPTLGHPCVFLRLATCNQHCSWCDTPFTWKWDEWDSTDEAHVMSYAEVKQRLVDNGLHDTGRVVISGGEPMLQWRQLCEMFEAHAVFSQTAIEIETAGTIAPRDFTHVYARFNVSPKLENSGNPKQQRYRPKALRAFAEFEDAIFKFVVAAPEDFAEIDEIVAECEIPRGAVYVMPEGVNATDVQEHARMVAEEVISRGWRLTTRLQVELWGNKRGV